MCPHHGPDRINERIPQDMDFELYKKIIDEGAEKGLKAVKLNYGGEPFLYPYLVDAIHYAKEKGILDVRMNTNNLQGTDLKEFFELNLLIITDYDQERQRDFATFYQKIKKVNGLATPKIQVKTNDPEKWKDIADEIVPNVYFKYDLEQDYTQSDFKCTQPWQRFLILADGTVCSCSCGLFLPEKILGNAWHFSLEELWNGEKMKFLRHCHEFGDTHLLKQCRTCPARKEYVKKENEKK